MKWLNQKVNGQSGMALKGRKQIGDAFASYLSLFDVVYHINGQQTILSQMIVLQKLFHIV
jgi:hypothetical protein